MAELMSASNPFLQFPFAPIRMECDARDLLVEGEIPRELRGTFYRNGPNQRFNPRGDYHLFAGDGMVHAFHIADGRVDYRNRWVRTAKWLAEDREGRNVVNPMNPFDCDPAYSDFVFTDKTGTANTAVLWHAGRMLAIEEGHPPFEIDPVTLESIGTWNYRGKLQTAMTAHPKVDPVTGELLFFAYMATGPFAADVMVHRVSPEGHLVRSLLIPTPYPAMVHDFVITEHHIILPIMPITGDLERVMSGGPAFAWEPDKGVHVAVLPRDSASADDVRWLEMDTCFVFHFMNAFERDGVVTVDACEFEHAPLFDTPDGRATGRATPRLSRWTMDLNQASPRVESVCLDREVEAEFPQCDPRFLGRAYRHGWYVSPDGELPSPVLKDELVYNTIGHYDHETGRQDRYSCGRGQVSEGIFVPRSPDAAEGEGYLLTVFTSFETRSSSLYIFDALSIARGPMARAHLQHHIPAGFHGGWRPGDVRR